MHLPREFEVNHSVSRENQMKSSSAQGLKLLKRVLSEMRIDVMDWMGQCGAFGWSIRPFEGRVL